jgi:hypothetical protein
MFKRVVGFLTLAVCVSACVTTQEMPLAPNIVRLDTRATGAFFTPHTAAITMQRAAALTVQNGFTHFRLEQAQVSQGSQLAGVYSTSSGTAFVNGNLVSANESGFSTPVMAPTADVGVTVIMFHASDAGAKGAFDASEVLEKYGK